MKANSKIPSKNGRERLSRARRRPSTGNTKLGLKVPRYVPVVSAICLVVALTATVNVRSFMDLRNENAVSVELNERVQEMTEENLGLQEEIYYLKNDANTIEREAKKYGLTRPQKQVSRAGELENAEKSTNRQTPTR